MLMTGKINIPLTGYYKGRVSQMESLPGVLGVIDVWEGL
jgi:hypothetical protein